MDVSEDRNVVVGFDSLMLATDAWVWTSTDGIVSLNNRLASLGVFGVPSLRAAVACSGDGRMIVGGGAFGPGFIVELPILVPFGTGTPGCNGFSVLTGSPAPVVNTPSFSLTSTNAPPNALGLVLVTNAANVQGSDPFFLGVTLHVDLFASTDTFTIDASSDAFGTGVAPAPIPNAPQLAGATYYAQTLWAWQLTSCFLPPYNLSTTNGLGITIQP